MSSPHSNLTGADLHEPKGVAAAAVDSIYQANGSGSGAWKLPIKKYTATLTPSTVPANTTSEQAFSIPGVVSLTDTVISVSRTNMQPGLGIVGWRITGDGFIGITYINCTSAPITPTGTEVYKFLVHRS